MTSTGVLGRPLEYFNGGARRELSDESFPDDPAEQIGRILGRGMTSNGVYGVKLFAFQRRHVESFLDWRRQLPGLKFVFLRRENRLLQAVSWARAVQNCITGPHSQLKEPKYDRSEIAERLRLVQEEYKDWSAYFDEHGIQPLEVTYEKLLIDPQGTVSRVATLANVMEKAVVREDAIDLTVQRDGLSDEWLRRYLLESRSQARGGFLARFGRLR